jgi:hypothetical protein
MIIFCSLYCDGNGKPKIGAAQHRDSDDALAHDEASPIEDVGVDRGPCRIPY